MVTTFVFVTDFYSVTCFIKCMTGGFMKHFAVFIPFMTPLEYSHADG